MVWALLMGFSMNNRQCGCFSAPDSPFSGKWTWSNLEIHSVSRSKTGTQSNGRNDEMDSLSSEGFYWNRVPSLGSLSHACPSRSRERKSSFSTGDTIRSGENDSPVSGASGRVRWPRDGGESFLSHSRSSKGIIA